jgi:glutamine synthetase
VADLLREVFTETSTVRFEGNGYSDEWKAEAKKRGLPNLADTPAALAAAREKQHYKFLVDTGVLTEVEVESRFNVTMERYIKQVMLEAETLSEMVTTAVVPAAEKQLAVSVVAWKALADIGGSQGTPANTARLKALSGGLESALAGVARIRGLLADLAGVHDEAKLCERLGHEMRPLMQDVRVAADLLEGLVDDELWPLPKYREMLFVK